MHIYALFDYTGLDPSKLQAVFRFFCNQIYIWIPGLSVGPGLRSYGVTRRVFFAPKPIRPLRWALPATWSSSRKRFDTVLMRTGGKTLCGWLLAGRPVWSVCSSNKRPAVQPAWEVTLHPPWRDDDLLSQRDSRMAATPYQQLTKSEACTGVKKLASIKGISPIRPLAFWKNWKTDNPLHRPSPAIRS